MTKIPLVILASARQSGDTLKLVNRILGGIEINIIDLLDYPVAHYNYAGTYEAEDQFINIIEKIIEHDLIIWATPVYWYSMSGMLKVFFDRLSDIITIRKDLGRQLAGIKTLLLAVGSSQDLPPGFDQPFRLTADYFNMEFLKIIYLPRKKIDLLSDAEINKMQQEILNK